MATELCTQPDPNLFIMKSAHIQTVLQQPRVVTSPGCNSLRGSPEGAIAVNQKHTTLCVSTLRPALVAALLDTHLHNIFPSLCDKGQVSATM